MDILETTRTLWHCVDYSKSKINQTCALSSCLKSLRVSAVQPFMLKKKTVQKSQSPINSIHVHHECM